MIVNIIYQDYLAVSSQMRRKNSPQKISLFEFFVDHDHAIMNPLSGRERLQLRKADNFVYSCALTACMTTYLILTYNKTVQIIPIFLKLKKRALYSIIPSCDLDRCMLIDRDTLTFCG